MGLTTVLTVILIEGRYMFYSNYITPIPNGTTLLVNYMNLQVLAGLRKNDILFFETNLVICFLSQFAPKKYLW